MKLNRTMLIPIKTQKDYDILVNMLEKLSVKDCEDEETKITIAIIEELTENFDNNYS